MEVMHSNFPEVSTIHRLNVGRIPTMNAGVKCCFSLTSMFHIFISSCSDSMHFQCGMSSAGIL